MNWMLGARWGLVLSLGLVQLGCSGDGGHGTTCQDYSALEDPEPLWINVTPAAEGPVARRGQAGAYDAVGDRLIVHGGRDKSGQVLGDTWLLLHASAASVAPAWAEVEPATGPAAPALQGAVAGYHPASDTFLLVGGVDEGGTTTMDVWRLAPAGGPAALWSRATPGGTPPSVRAEMAAAYDPANDSLYLFGGRAADGSGLLNDTWVLGSATGSPMWTKLEAQGELPDPRAAAAVVYDPEQRKLVLYGGSTAAQSPGVWNQDLHDTWVLENTALPGADALWIWTQMVSIGYAPPLARHSLVLDPDRHRAVRFGGLVSPGSQGSDTSMLVQEEQHAVWSVIQAGSPQPSPRSQHVAGFSPGSHRMIVYGGALVEDRGEGVVLETDPTGEVWVLRNASGFESQEMASLTIVAPSTVLCVGNTMQLTPKLLGPDGEVLDGVDFEWSFDGDGEVSMNSPVSSAEPGGLVTAVARGPVRIFARPTGSVVTGQIAITVEQPEASGPSRDGGGGGSCPAVATCCTTRGGIQVVGITCPTGTCPPGTFVIHDSSYDVDQCSCDC